MLQQSLKEWKGYIRRNKHSCGPYGFFRIEKNTTTMQSGISFSQPHHDSSPTGLYLFDGT
jgi:hypothetical protein